MTRALIAAAWLVGFALAALCFTMLVGLAVHRSGPALLISAATTFIVFAPTLMSWLAAPPKRRVGIAAASLITWAGGLLLALPMFFPGERNEAIVSGIAALTGGDRLGVAEGLGAQLPIEPSIARPELAEAAAARVVELPPPLPLDDHQIALPYEGDGRRLSVPVVFHHLGRDLEVQMMLDTGATYTTLPHAILEQLGIRVGDDAPTLELHTANGVRTAQLALVDEVWLGDLDMNGVAIATCDACASGDTVGLLGLNVSGGFNLNINADRHEVVFSRRLDHDRVLDIRPFSKLTAGFTRFPGGRVEVEVTFNNLAERPIAQATALVSCDAGTWQIPLRDTGSGAVNVQRLKLPSHPKCDGYQIRLRDTAW